jgi:glutathione S-transferase
MFRELGMTPEIEIVDLFQGGGRRPEYLAINPNGFVPTLVDGDVVLVESAAILIYLADKYPEKKLAPRLGTRERALYHQYMVYGPSTVDAMCELVWYHSFVLPEPRRVPGAVDYARRRFKHIGGALSQMIGEQPFVCGNDFSAADIVISSGVGWAKRMEMLKDHPRLEAYLERATSRPAFANPGSA